MQLAILLMLVLALVSLIVTSKNINLDRIQLLKVHPTFGTCSDLQAHPDVYNHMVEKGWDKKPGVRILFGRWQDVLEQLVPCGYDGIFFDTFGEFYEQLKDFHEVLGDYLRYITPLVIGCSFFV